MVGLKQREIGLCSRFVFLVEYWFNSCYRQPSLKLPTVPSSILIGIDVISEFLGEVLLTVIFNLGNSSYIPIDKCNDYQQLAGFPLDVWLLVSFCISIAGFSIAVAHLQTPAQFLQVWVGFFFELVDSRQSNQIDKASCVLVLCLFYLFL